MDWSDELIALITSSPRICKHAHVPLQSGSDRILRKMHRKYRPWHYAEKLEKIRSLMPNAAIGADVMVGFPGETDELFEESRQFIARLPLTYLHVFTYSPRPNTPAAAMADQVPLHVARDRNRILRKLSVEKNLEFRSRFLGQTLDAITLSSANRHETEALTDNYLKMRIDGTLEQNQWVRARVKAVLNDGLAAELAH
jgi:threonylcarbamoyladenosine tRNA methylthiotransferase MtaB